MKDFTQSTVWERMEKDNQRHPIGEEPKHGYWLLCLLILSTVIAGTIIAMATAGIGISFILEADQYAVVQTYRGDLWICDVPGWHMKKPWLEKVYYYPRHLSVSFMPINDKAINCSFQDTGLGKVGLGIWIRVRVNSQLMVVRDMK